MFPSPVPVLSFMLVFVFVFVPRRPRLPRRREAGAAGVAGSGGAAIVGSAGVAGSADIAGAAARPRRCLRALRAAPPGVNEQTCVAPGTVVSVRRSPDFLARIEIMVGVLPGVVPVAGVNSPNCIATAV